MIELNSQYLIKTTNLYYVGKIVAIDPMQVKLDICSEVHETGEQEQMLGKGVIKTKEFLGDGVIVPRFGSVFIPYPQDLPRGRII